jgi:hypothetical protein
MSLVVEHPQLPAPAALGDEESTVVALRPDHAEPAEETRPLVAEELVPNHHPPSELLLTVASVAVWVGLGLAVRRLLSRG